MKKLTAIRMKHVEKGNAQDYGGNSLAGTTANVCLLTKDKIYIANAGDSRAFAICRGSKSTAPKYVSLSKDHKPDLDCEKERILKAGGVITEGRINNNLNLSRALGDFEYKKNPLLNAECQIISAVPDVKSMNRKDASHIFIGCDGVW